MEKIFFSPREAAETLRLDRLTIYRWIKAGKIKIRRLPDGQIRIQRSELDKILR